MDKSVIDAMARWPDVPDVYGWLSLNEQGNWRLHPQGTALDSPDDIGEAISSPPILQFIGRNYAADEQGQWYFQNGPQRVYVRLDAAPFVVYALRTPECPFQLLGHTGLEASTIRMWLLASDGRLYIQTSHGGALIQGRDLEAVLAQVRTKDGTRVLDFLADDLERQAPFDVLPLDAATLEDSQTMIPFRFAKADDIPGILGFSRRPQPKTS
ncbi:DUF2946 family protein [Allopusillimonas ginsengisoli]|uniref:DUF2946 family protein n=1 Tax=Allopusillimonas ginsengisoli TaxID=453575 RepID=UPI00101FF061|nr:DUF2946 family protein [Allopusillimonas ginsengisoli]TEA77438.1 DUF2946 family protein [Allopusillimonas ginsengisoli]